MEEMFEVGNVTHMMSNNFQDRQLLLHRDDEVAPIKFCRGCYGKITLHFMWKCFLCIL